MLSVLRFILRIISPATLAAILAFAGGWAVCSLLSGAMRERAEARLASCLADRERDARAAAEETARLLAAAQSAERAAAARLQTVEEQLHGTDRRLRQALTSVARAESVCFSADTRRVLNDAHQPTNHLSTRAAGADPANAGSAADSGGSRGAASERAVAEWATTVIRLYGECRARIDAIRQWDEMTYDAR